MPKDTSRVKKRKDEYKKSRNEIGKLKVKDIRKFKQHMDLLNEKIESLKNTVITKYNLNELTDLKSQYKNCLQASAVMTIIS